jgi:hypothetical protein
MTHPEPAGHVPPPGTPVVTQADRWQWQYRATRALAAILDAHPDVPAITWTLTQTGSLAGQVNGIGIPPEQARATYTAWQHALRIDSVKETPIRDTGMVALTGRTYHGTVLVGLTTRLYYPLPDDEAPAETLPAAPAVAQQSGSRVRPARESREPAAEARGTTSTTRPDRFQARPLSPSWQHGGPQQTTHTLGRRG